MPRKSVEKGSKPTQNKSGIKTKQIETELKGIKTKSYSEEQEEMMKKPYRCVTCGKRYSSQANNFSYSQSPLYDGNNHYLPTCVSCIDNLIGQYTELLGSQNEAIKRVCLHYDIYVSDSLLNSCKKIDANRSRIKNYIRQCNMQQNAGKTYDTYLREIKSDTIETIEDLEKLNSEAEIGNEIAISERTVKRWGLGYSETEYQMLNDHYKMLKDKAGDDDVKDALIKDLCEQHILKYRARQDKDMDRYEKISKLYQQTLSNADLKPKDNAKNNTSLNNPDECWGNFISMVENFSPAEFFKDKNIFKDYNGIEDYCNRHIKRSTENLINGTSIRDLEYNVEGDNDDT